MTSEERKEYNKKYRLANKDKIKESQKDWRKKNPDYNKKYDKENPEKSKIKQKKFREKNREKINSQARERYSKNKESIKKYRSQRIVKDKALKRIKIRRNSDPIFKFKMNVRRRLLEFISEKGFKKRLKTETILGCSFKEFELYIESKFESWMTWENRGLYNGEFNYGWDIDHIIPLSTAITEEDVIRLNHHTNLQPLCSKINRDIKRAS